MASEKLQACPDVLSAFAELLPVWLSFYDLAVESANMEDSFIDLFNDFIMTQLLIRQNTTF